MSLYAGVLQMNGKTLTLAVRDKDSQGNTSWSYSFSFNRSRVRTPGHIVLESGRLTITGQTLSDGTAVWDGDASNTLTLKDRTRLAISNSKTVLPWKLIPEAGSGVWVSGDVDASFDNNAWSGSIELTGAANIPFSYTKNQKGTMNLSGSISGPGGLFWNGYTTLHLWGENSYEGLTTANGGSAYGYTPIYVHGGRSLPMNDKGLKLTDGNLPLPGEDFYELPKVDYSNAVDVAMTGARAQGGTLAQLVKTGIGRLDLAARLVVTGAVELKQGAIRLPSARSAAAGLVYTCTNATDDAQSADMSQTYWYSVTGSAGTTLPSDVRNTYLSPHFCYTDPLPAWLNYAAISFYDGYVWNNTSEDKTWSFMTGIQSRSKLFVNGSLENEQISYQYAIFKHVTLHPGANKFRFAICANKGSKGADVTYEDYKDFSDTWHKVAGSTDFSWSKYNALGISKTGTDSMKETDYEKAIDAGDGLLFTVTTNFSEMVSYRPAFSNFTGWAGATLDLNERMATMAIPKFAGECTVANGILAVSECWTIRAAELAKGNKLMLTSAELAFAEGAVIDVDDVAGLDRSRHIDNPYVIAVTDGTFDALPEVGGTLLEKGWNVKLSNDAKSMLLYRESPGVIMILK